MSARRSPTRCGRRRRFKDQGGFTLVEVLVAFTVMAVLLSVLFRGVVVVRAGSQAFDDHTDEELVARAVLGDALAARDLANGTTTGLRDGLRWTLAAKPIDLSGQMPPPTSTAKADATAPAGAAQTGQPAPAPGKKDDKPEWATQRLVVRVGTAGRPLEIQTIRMVKAE